MCQVRAQLFCCSVHWGCLLQLVTVTASQVAGFNRQVWSMRQHGPCPPQLGREDSWLLWKGKPRSLSRKLNSTKVTAGCIKSAPDHQCYLSANRKQSSHLFRWQHMSICNWFVSWSVLCAEFNANAPWLTCKQGYWQLPEYNKNRKERLQFDRGTPN